jgi:hypothetical protein
MVSCESEVSECRILTNEKYFPRAAAEKRIKVMKIFQKIWEQHINKIIETYQKGRS